MSPQLRKEKYKVSDYQNFSFSSHFKTAYSGVGDLTRWLRPLAALVEVLDLVPVTHMVTHNYMEPSSDLHRHSQVDTQAKHSYTLNK